MPNRQDRGRHDDELYAGHQRDGARESVRQLGARDGEGLTLDPREAPRPASPRYERDEGYDGDRDNTRFTQGSASSERATSRGRSESFVDAFRRDEAGGRFGGMGHTDFGVRREDGIDRDRYPSRYDHRASGGGFDHQSAFAGRAHGHVLPGDPNPAAGKAAAWGPWGGQDYASHARASTHPSPYTPHIGPLARLDESHRLAPHPEEDHGWSGAGIHHTSSFGGGLRNPAWEVPFQRDPTTGWGPRTHIGKGPRGYVRSDDRVREEVCDCLSDGYVDASEVEVAVRDGVVILTGQATDKMSKRRIEDIADGCRGVVAVENLIRVQGVTSRRTGPLTPTPAETEAARSAPGVARPLTTDKSIS